MNPNQQPNSDKHIVDRGHITPGGWKPGVPGDNGSRGGKGRSRRGHVPNEQRPKFERQQIIQRGK